MKIKKFAVTQKEFFCQLDLREVRFYNFFFFCNFIFGFYTEAQFVITTRPLAVFYCKQQNRKKKL